MPVQQTLGDSPPAGRLHLPACDLSTVRQWLCDAGHPRFRAEQVLKWIYEQNATTFEAMSNLSKPLRAWLAERALIYSSEVTREAVAADGTRRLLLTLADGATTETVWIPAGRRNTACLSTQVGCAVGCRFCASGLDGLQRNLTAGEIVEQALRIRLLIAGQTAAGATPGRLSNIVIMGMGEPLANYAQLVQALRVINAPWGLGIGARKITVSTVGLPQQIRRLAREDLQLNLALSLHAPDDALRRELVPWARGAPLAELIESCRYYFQETGREVTLEYVLLDDVNTRAEHAAGLAKIARRLRANVNLLRYNPVAGLAYRRPSSETAHDFQRRLRERGVNAHVRSSRGADVDAACGQLRRRTRSANGGTDN
jgi:23S rRNA (adenine2503-C2)-methyltransferase